MLEEILRYIYENRMYSKSKIAQDLNLEEGLVEQGLNQLLNMGYLQEDQMSQSCSSNCSTCPLSSCDLNRINTYTLTEKGLNFLK